MTWGSAQVQAKGRVGIPDYVRCRVRYLADGLVLGSRGYVEEIFRGARDRFSPKCTDGARRMRGVTVGLYVLRNLRVDVFG